MILPYSLLWQEYQRPPSALNIHISEPNALVTDLAMSLACREASHCQLLYELIAINLSPNYTVKFG